jgi:hypothetical protein
MNRPESLAAWTLAWELRCRPVYEESIHRLNYSQSLTTPFTRRRQLHGLNEETLYSRCATGLLDRTSPIAAKLFGTNFKFRTCPEEADIKLKEEISLT